MALSSFYPEEQAPTEVLHEPKTSSVGILDLRTVQHKAKKV